MLHSATLHHPLSPLHPPAFTIIMSRGHGAQCSKSQSLVGQQVGPALHLLETPSPIHDLRGPSE